MKALETAVYCALCSYSAFAPAWMEDAGLLNSKPAFPQWQHKASCNAGIETIEGRFWRAERSASAGIVIRARKR